jgi:transposase-like protein
MIRRHLKLSIAHALEDSKQLLSWPCRQRKIFRHDEAAMKVIYLAIENASKKWSMPLCDWKPAINQFMIMLQDRVLHLI